MSISRLIRPTLAIAVLALGGCVVPPPPVVVQPGQTYLSQQCSAGAYQCILSQAGPVGAPCACPGLGAPSYGVIR